MSELGDFLAAYAQSYETYDPIKVANFIHCPCVFFLRDDCVLLDARSKINEFMQTGLESYKASDCVRFKARLLGERRIGSRFALIDVEWSPENADGKWVMHFSTTYNLVRDEGGWKVSMITRHDR